MFKPRCFDWATQILLFSLANISENFIFYLTSTHNTFYNLKYSKSSYKNHETKFSKKQNSQRNWQVLTTANWFEKVSLHFQISKFNRSVKRHLCVCYHQVILWLRKRSKNLYSSMNCNFFSYTQKVFSNLEVRWLVYILVLRRERISIEQGLLQLALGWIAFLGNICFFLWLIRKPW